MEGMPGLEIGREDGAAVRVEAVQRMSQCLVSSLPSHDDAEKKKGKGAKFVSSADQTFSQFSLITNV